MIHFNNVTKKYGDIDPAVDSINLAVEKGEFISIVGKSGAGKTTILKLLLGEESPTSGDILFEEKNVHSMSRSDISFYRRRIGAVFQDCRLLPSKTAYENIAFAMEVAGRTDAEIEADVPTVLELVDMGDKMWRFPHELSGGEEQRVAIARAIVNRPDLVIADEPTGNLDPVSTHDIVQILKKINDLGTTVILTTHNTGVIDSLKKRVITMDAGKIVNDDAHGRYSLR